MKQTARWTRWPSGDCRTVMLLRQQPGDLAARYGLTFERAVDDFDAYCTAAVADPEVGQFWLWRYERSPAEGTEVVFDASIPVRTAVGAVERQLNVRAADREWTIGDPPRESEVPNSQRTAKPVVVILHGPSGVGKDTVIDRLRERTGIHRALSSTTRARRGDESGEGHYHFMTRDEFERRAAAGAFLEFAEVYGDLKGLERSEVLPYLERGEDVVIRTDVQGARTWRKRLPSAVNVFLMADDRDTLRKRLVDRATEDKVSLARRLAELEEELADIPNNDYVVVNRDSAADEAAAELALIIERERSNFLRPRPALAE